MDNFVLRIGEIVPGLVSTDGVHLTQAGTEKLIDNINRVLKLGAIEKWLVSVCQVGLIKQMIQMRGNPTAIIVVKKHTLSNYKFDKRIKCFWNGLEHK